MVKKPKIVTIVKEKGMYSTNELILLVVAATLLGLVVGFFVAQDKVIGTFFRSDAVNLYRSDKYIADFVSVYDNVVNGFYQEVDQKELIDGAVDGMLKKLDDPYTVFLNDKETKSLDTFLEGNYLGIGVILETNNKGQVYVKSMFPSTPAVKAGLKIGDEIININNTYIKGKTSSEVMQLLRNDAIKELTLVIQRNKQQLTFKILKQKIEIPTVIEEIINKDDQLIGYMALNFFSTNTPKQVASALKNFEKQKIKGLIIDVRDNGGGQLNSLDQILDLFMTKKDLMYQIKTANYKLKRYAKGNESFKLPICVLINENSASASEILAAAFKETYDATLVGKKTYGKGTVQQAAHLRTGGMYKFTSQEWLTPLGNSINNKGVIPDVEVELSPLYQNAPTNENDSQLQKAISIIID